MLADWTYTAEGGQFSSNEHGNEAFTCFVPMSLIDAFRFYDLVLGRHLVVSNGIDRPFSGRIEDRAIVPGGLEITALGYWACFTDAPYTGLWSKLTTADFEPVTDSNLSDRSPERYAMDNNNRLYIALREGEGYGPADHIGEFTWAAPHNGEGGIGYIGYSYDVTLPADWEFRILAANYDFSGVTVINTLTATGSNQTGSGGHVISPAADRILIQARNNSESKSTPAGETGTWYVKLTNFGLQVSSSLISANLIAAGLLAYIAPINNQLSTSTALIESAGAALGNDEIYEDQYPADILIDLASRADNQVPPRRWEVGVDNNRMFYFRPRGAAAKTWYTDIVDVTLQGSLDGLANEVYAVYKDVSGRVLRTAVASNAESITSHNGITKRAIISSDTVNPTRAERDRDLALSENAQPLPRLEVVTSGLYTAEGAIVPLWQAQPGDLVVIRNLPPIYSPIVDKIRKFYVSSIQYDMDADQIAISPSLELPTLENLIGKAINRTPYINEVQVFVVNPRK